MAAVAGLLLLVLLSIPLARSIIGPVRRVATVLDSLADGDLTRYADVTTRDELGVMAAALNRAIDNTRRSVQASACTASTDATAQARDRSAEVARGAEELRALVGQFQV